MDRFVLLFLVALSLSRCGLFQKKEDPAKTPVARAAESYLYVEDLRDLIPGNISQADSQKLAEKIVEDWVKRQLMVGKASEEIAVDQDAIERKVTDYRYALLVHEFEKLYINAHLNSTVDLEEIQAYYNEKSENFVLKQNIVRCLFVKVPKSAPERNQLRRNIRSYPQTNMEDIEEYCLQYAMKSFLEDSIWINFEEVISGTPLQGLSDKVRFLRNTTFSETSDQDFYYFIRLLDYKISDQISPLEFIREDIENIIINKRKLALKKELEKTIHDEAIRNNSFEIYRN